MSPRSLALAALLLAACDPRAVERSAPSDAGSAAASVAPLASIPAPALPAVTGSAGSASSTPAETGAPAIRFVRDGKVVRVLSRAELEAALPPEQWTAFDPYYKKPKTFRAVPLAGLLERGFGEPAATLSTHDFVLRARDGYAVPLPGVRLFEKGGYVAVADVEVPGWEPIGQGHANPGPFYMVWRETAQQGLETHPRPWQLASIELAPFETTYPHAVPPATDVPARRGFLLFRKGCISCHAINREGGRVGPDLNVPQSIVEYRPEPQIRAYIRDPHTFRYSTMPAHPDFGEGDLDALLAYFRAMKDHKHDPDGKPGGR